MTRPLSPLQIHALASLANGWRWGIAVQTAFALRRRGLVEIDWIRLRNGRLVRLPRLTDAGVREAAAIRDDAILRATNVVELRQVTNLPLFEAVR